MVGFLTYSVCRDALNVGSTTSIELKLVFLCDVNNILLMYC